MKVSLLATKTPKRVIAIECEHVRAEIAVTTKEGRALVQRFARGAASSRGDKWICSHKFGHTVNALDCAKIVSVAYGKGL